MQRTNNNKAQRFDSSLDVVYLFDFFEQLGLRKARLGHLAFVLNWLSRVVS